MPWQVGFSSSVKVKDVLQASMSLARSRTLVVFCVNRIGQRPQAHDPDQMASRLASLLPFQKKQCVCWRRLQLQLVQARLLRVRSSLVKERYTYKKALGQYALVKAAIHFSTGTFTQFIASFLFSTASAL